MSPVDPLRAEWRKSTQSNTNEGACVEVASLSDTIAIRDSKDPAGDVLRFDRSAFRKLTGHIRTGLLDL